MISENDINTCCQYFDSMASDTAVCRKFIENLITRMENGYLSMQFGNELLNYRNQLLLDYLINLTKLLRDKTEGISLESNPVVDRAIEMRVYIEKIQKIYKKMSYQIEKTLSYGKNITDKQANPLVFKPAPHNLVIDEESDSNVSEEERMDQATSTSKGTKKKTSKSNIYVPPKVAAMMYDDDETAELSKQKAMQKAKKRALSSSIIQDLRRQYDDGPEEITSGMRRKNKADKKLKEIKEFEEDNFIRLSLSKNDKKSLKQSAQKQSLADEITQFGDTSFLTMDEKSSNRQSSKRPKPKSKPIKKKSIKRKFRK